MLLLQTAVLAIFFLLGVHCTIAQSSGRDCESESKASNKCKRLTIESFSFCFPPHYEMREKSGIDLSYWEHIDSGIVIRLYVGPGSPTEGAYAQSLSSFEKERTFIDEVFTTIWSYEDDSAANRYVVGARYYVDGTERGNALSIFVRSDRPESKEIADAIIRSFKIEKGTKS